jgi:PAS domain S-box-containing protein
LNSAVQGRTSNEDAELWATFRAQQLKSLARHGPLTLPMLLLAALAMASMLWEQRPGFVATWLLACAVLIGISAVRVRRNIHLKKASASNIRIGTAIVVTLAGLWAAIPIVALQHVNEAQEHVIMLAMASMSAGGTLVLQAMPLAATVWCVALIAGTVWSFLHLEMGYAMELSCFSIMYGGVLIRNAFISSSDLFSRIKLTHEASELARSLARQAQIVQATRNGVLMLDTLGHVVWANAGATEGMGYTLAELASRGPWFRWNESKAERDLLWQTLTQQKQAHGELICHHRDGRSLCVQVDAWPMHDAHGQPDGYVLIGTDVTDLRRLPNELRIEQERQAHIIDGTHCGTWEIDFDLGASRIGGHWSDIVGVNTSRPLVVEGIFLVDRIHPDDMDGHRAALRRYLKGAAQQYSHEFRIRHEDGSWRWVHARGKASRLTESGQIEQMSGSVTDISAAKATELALVEATKLAQQASEAKSLFLATMSHEIRTPMNGVLGTAEWLNHTQLSEEQREGIETISASGKSLLAIVDDILDFSKVEAGKMSLLEEAVAIAQVTESVFDALLPVAESKRVDLHVFIDPRLPTYVVADGTRLRQIMVNLASNALKFASTPDGPRGQVDMHILTSDDGTATWRIHVSDNGIGMSNDTLGRLFSPFSQADASTSRRFGGTGLGLVITHRLVALMGGAIAVHSQLGQGSSFEVTLPLVASPVIGEAAPAIDLSGVECLLLRGQNFRPATLAAYLTHAGAHVRTASGPDVIPCPQGEDEVMIVVRDAPDDQRGGANVVAPESPVRFLHVGRYSRGPSRMTSPQVVQLGRAHVQDVLRAVAVLAGRRSPEIARNEPAHMASIGWPQGPTWGDHHANAPKVLVAEDDTTNQKVIRRQLQLLGVPCEVVADGMAALQRWRSDPFALILSDLHMPELDGYELARRIRSEEASTGRGRTPMLALTANALKGEEVRALACGMDAYLTKPIALEELRLRLAQWLPLQEASRHASPPGQAPRLHDPLKTPPKELVK